MTVGIIGLGLIGGSLGLALTPTNRVVGYDPISAKEALAKGAIQEALSFEETVKAADILILALPLGLIPATIAKCAPLLKKDAVLVDVGSAKGSVCEAMRKHLPQQSVGGHPMAGTEFVGIEHASGDLFQNATFVLTPETPEEEKTAKKVKKLLSALPVKWLEMPAQEHDLTVAYTSHLPYIMSILTARAASSTDLPYLKELMAGGFRDTTRLAAQNPTMGRDLCLTNREAILAAISGARYGLSQLEWMIENQSKMALEMMLEETSHWRQGLSI